MERYYIPDVETGFKQEVSKEVWEFYKRNLDNLMAQLHSSSPRECWKAVPIIFGTGGDLESGKKAEEIFFKEL